MHRQIYWSLVGSMVVASLFTLALSAAWNGGATPSAWTAAGFAATVLVALWLAWHESVAVI